MKHILATAAVIVALTGSAFAGSCPTLVNKVDEALKTTTVSAEEKSKVMALRTKGAEQHASGMHDEAVATLNEAIGLLGM